MPLETATYISQLVTTNPANADGLNQADDHMRLIKAALLNTFPNFTAAALTSTQAAIDTAVAASAAITARSGTVPAGALMDFAMATAPAGWLECNGAAVSRTTYAALFTAIGTTHGVGDGSTTFNLPGDRYRVGRTTAAAAVGTLQASQNKSHTHTGSGTTGTESVDHSHAVTGSTGIESNDHTHTYTAPNAASSTTGGGAFAIVGSVTGGTATSGVTVNHTHPFSVNSGGRSAAHTHTYSFTSSVGSADGTDARPLSQVVLTCIKT